MSTSSRLSGKVAVVTGASSGIGAAIVRAFTGEGARVVLAARGESQMREVVETCARGSETLVVPTDVGDEEQVAGLISRTVDEFGRIDILVNNAGFGNFKPITEMTTDEFDTLVRVNLRGVFLCTKHVLPQMYRQNGGSVITISSLAGKHGFAGGAGYCATKFGVMGMMESVFMEARAHDVRIITLTPGSVDTPFFDGAHMTPPNRDRILGSEDVAATVLMAVTLPQRALIRELDIRPTNPR